MVERFIAPACRTDCAFRACRAPAEASGSTAALLGFDSGTTIFDPRGCRACGGTGYAGRMGVFEAVRIDAPLRQLIDCGGDAAVIANQAFRNAPSLGAAARALVREGTASAEDVIRLSRGECPSPPRAL
jgi:general secretion pathway protein E